MADGPSIDGSPIVSSQAFVDLRYPLESVEASASNFLEVASCFYLLLRLLMHGL